jgi:hypothetical protein
VPGQRVIGGGPNSVRGTAETLVSVLIFFHAWSCRSL